jgi:hypothetical protein
VDEKPIDRTLCSRKKFVKKKHANSPEKLLVGGYTLTITGIAVLWCTLFLK